MKFPFEYKNTYINLPQEFYFIVRAQKFSSPEVVELNERLFNELGGDKKDISKAKLGEFFSGQFFPEYSPPLALVYAGHQFGHFVPSLGDGRALLLGEIITPKNLRFDIALKGSGPTPFSRRGDGLSALGPALRQYIVSEAMNILDVPTTRSLAVTITNEPVYREEVLPGAVLTRVASSHIRIGTFEYFSYRNNLHLLKLLSDYSINRHYPYLNDSKDKYFNFFASVAKNQMKLIAKWMSLGFIHGVMNTDNMSISGETIDYGPCAFMDEFEFHKVFSSIDHGKRYSYANQPHIARWNLSSLANTLFPLMEGNDDEKSEKINHILNQMLFDFRDFFHDFMLPKLGLFKSDLKTPEEKDEIIQLFLNYLADEKLDFTLSFRNLSELLLDPHYAFYKRSESFQLFYSKWSILLKNQNIPLQTVQGQMDQINPLYVPRNHLVEKAIQNAYQGDFTFFRELNNVLKNPFEHQEKFKHFQLPPTENERVLKTFCGT